MCVSVCEGRVHGPVCLCASVDPCKCMPEINVWWHPLLSPVGFFKIGSLTKTGNHWPAKAAGQWTLMPHQVPPFTSPFPARYRDTNVPDQLLSQCQGSELGSSRCVASPLLTETSSQVLKEFEANLQAQPLSDKLHPWIFYGLWLRRIKSHS